VTDEACQADDRRRAESSGRRAVSGRRTDGWKRNGLRLA
jgi:hypothetical protein